MKQHSQKVIYSVGPDNRLVVKRPGRKPMLIPGVFRVQENKLVYLACEKNQWLLQHDLAKEIALTGTWKLDKDHNLIIQIAETAATAQSVLTLKGAIAACTGNELVFSLKSKTGFKRETFYLIRLKGRWQADTHNRLTFEVVQRPSPDTLVFQGTWDINRNQKLIYSYTRQALATKLKTSHELVFQGFWQITRRNHLGFAMSGSGDSGFDFKVQLASPSLYPKKGEIKYRLGIGTGKRRYWRVITLYGAWKFSRSLGLCFEMDYGNHQIKTMRFDVSVRLNETDTLALALRDSWGQLLGMTLAYSRRMLPESAFEYFLKFRRQGADTSIMAGATRRF